jgi:hypothetical protein
MNRTLIRAAALALALQQAATATVGLAAQDTEGPGPADPACSLVTEKEVEAATGLDYRPGEDIEQEYEWIEGGETCMWGGPSMAYEDLPEIDITVIATGAGESHTEQRHKRRLAQGCTREPVSSVGDRAFAEICDGKLFGVSVYARTGSNDVVVRVYHLAPMPKASVKPAAIALARAAAARAKGM